jgi:hypothetical protein
MSECKFEHLIDEYLLNRLSEESRSQFEEHYFNCPACFQEMMERDEMIAAIKWKGHRIFADQMEQEQIRKVTIWERVSGLMSPRQWVTAAVTAALVLVVALVVVPGFRTQSPQFFLDDDQTRGRAITLVSDSVPGHFEWQTVADAVEYKILIENHEPLWQDSTTDNFTTLPDEIKAKMVPGRKYFWQVKAFSKEGRLIAMSSKIQFTIPK